MHDEHKQLAKKILAWISFAVRSLLIKELQEALAVEPKTSKLDETNMQDEDLLTDVCAGLVVVDKQSQIVRLCHYTTEQFLRRVRQERFPTAHVDIAETCLTYLLFDEFNESSVLTEWYLGRPKVYTDTHPDVYPESYSNLDEDCVPPNIPHSFKGYTTVRKYASFRPRHNHLFKYAAVNWGWHVQGPPEIPLSGLVLRFLASQSRLANCVQNGCYAKDFVVQGSSPYPRNIVGLHIAAHFGLESTAKILLA